MRPCDEIFGGNGRTYIFTASMGNVESFQNDENGMDVALFSAKLGAGEMPVKQIRCLLAHTIAEVDGSSDFDVEFEVDTFLQDFGLEDSARACTMILHTAVVGRVKKNIEVAMLQRRRRLLLIGAHLKRYGLLWAAILIIGTIAPWLNLNWLMIVFASVME